jgi:hypothetical protein
MTTIEDRRAAGDAAAEKINELAKAAQAAKDELDKAMSEYIANSFVDVELADSGAPLPENATVIGPLSDVSRRDIQRLNALSGGINNAILEIKRSVSAGFKLLSDVEGAVSKAVWTKIAKEHGFDLEAEGIEYGTHVVDGKPVVYSVPYEDPFEAFLAKMGAEQAADAIGEQAAA